MSNETVVNCLECGSVMTEVVSEVDGYMFHICERCKKATQAVKEN